MVLEYELVVDRAAVQVGSQSSYLPFELNKPAYQRPLNASRSEIRLLAVEPGVFEDPIRSRLVYSRLRRGSPTAHAFDALSYSWGYPRDLTTINVRKSDDDAGAMSKLHITPSAQLAIRRLRHPTRITNLWIDAVCINQSDSVERAQQVSMMTTIYSNAHAVRVWLGPHHPAIAWSLRIIRDVHNYNFRECPGGIECSCEGSRHACIADLERSDKNKSLQNHRGIEAIFNYHFKRFAPPAVEYAGGHGNQNVSKLFAHLFDCSWFRRSWVVREVLAARACTVHCGPDTITWKELLDVNNWMTDPQYIAHDPHVQRNQVMMPAIWSTLFEKLAQARRADMKGAGAKSEDQAALLDVYLESLDLKSSEPRDKLYALLSFARETAQPDDISDLVGPNYTKTDEQVFADFTIWWIRKYRSLSVLSSVHCQRERAWVRPVCDLQKDRPLTRPTWVVPSHGKSTWGMATLAQQFKFRAGGETSCEISLLEDTLGPHAPALRLGGYEIARIKRIAYLDVNSLLADKEYAEMFSVYDTVLDPVDKLGRWKERPYPESPENLRYGERLQQHLAAHWTYLRGPKVPAISLGKGTPVLKDIDSIPTCFDPFAFTTFGDLIGLCPWTAHKNDLVVLLYGASVPYLLRPTTDGDETYELVGECYVAGIMQGQLMDTLRAQEAEQKRFTLI